MPGVQAALVSLLALLTFVSGAASETALPDALDEWLGTPARVTEFTISKGAENLGQWQNRVYTRRAPVAGVEVNLTEGQGPGTLFVPEGGVVTSDAPIGFASTYETLNLAGRRAVLERGEVTGQALAVALGENRTLTLETKSLSRDELLGFARKLILTLEGK
jgi:hypothetical protein